MSANVVYSNAQFLTSTTIPNKKRPQHPSPANSYRTAGERNSAMKRARWDISRTVNISTCGAASVDRVIPICSSFGPVRNTFPACSFGTFTAHYNLSTVLNSLWESAKKIPVRDYRAGVPIRLRLLSFFDHNNNITSPPLLPIKTSQSFHGLGFRWLVTVVDPDDEPFFPLGGSNARTASTMDTAFAFERLRRSTFDEGESFVNKMREWERERLNTQQEQLPSSHHLRSPDAGKMGVLAGQEDTDGAMDSAASASYSSASPPHMSNSISSNSSTATSGSGSEGGPFAFGLFPSIGFSSQRPSLGAERKRSWSIVEEDDAASACDGGEMDWEVVASAQRPAIGLRSKSTAEAEARHELVHTEGSSRCFSPSVEVTVPGAETAEDGDDEQEDSSSMDDDDESDDDLIFVIGNNIPTESSPAESAGQAPEPTAVSTDRMISELNQILAAGGADLEDNAIESEAFFELDLGTENPAVAHGHDAGGLWQ
ncbi:hypothetical protein FRB90_002642 [Tulasnella sp. 427]|nr:hypothetical protein FRB90_002642 [Tulasnella sp. 427]